MNKSNAVVTVDVNPTKSSTSLLKIDPSKVRIIEGFNERKDFGDIEGLAQSILENGQLEPIIVSKVKGEDFYDLIEGERRLTAINLLRANGEDFPYIVAATNQMSMEERLFAQLITGSLKKPLTPIEQARVIKKLVNKSYEPAEIAKKMGKSVSYVNQALELVATPKEMQNMVADGDIAATTAVQLVRELGEGAVDAVKEAVAEIKAEEGGEVVTTKGKKKKVAASKIKAKVEAKKAPKTAKKPNVGNLSILMGDVFDAVRELDPKSSAMDLLDDIITELGEAQDAKRIPSVKYLAESFLRNCKPVQK